METLIAERQLEIAPERIEQKIRALDWRDIQLWCIGFVVLVVLAAGFVALLAPQLVWHISAVVARQQDIVQLIFGLTALLILLNLYLFQQRLVLLQTRRELIRQLQIAERKARTDDKINDALRDEGATLVHFICHGADKTGMDQTVYLRDMVNNLSCSAVEGLEGFVTGFPRDHTFVFLNACEVGRAAPSLVGIGGSASTFLKLGASGVVAALWSVKDGVAHQVAENFYQRVINEPGTPFAEILRDIRSKAYSGAAEDTYAAYCFYGSPLARRKI